MSNRDQEDGKSEIQFLQREIARLRAEQAAAENIATHVGMTHEDSEQYRMRHFRIRVLTKRLAMLEGAHHEQKQTQETARQSAEGPESDQSSRQREGGNQC